MTEDNNKIQPIKIVPEPAEDRLNQRQLLDYRNPGRLR
jgi:hypothetical protein